MNGHYLCQVEWMLVVLFCSFDCLFIWYEGKRKQGGHGIFDVEQRFFFIQFGAGNLKFGFEIMKITHIAPVNISCNCEQNYYNFNNLRLFAAKNRSSLDLMASLLI